MDILAKWLQVSSDMVGPTLDTFEHPGDGALQLIHRREVPVVCSGQTGMVPKPLRRVQFRAVGRQIINRQPCALLSKPSPDIFVFVVRRIVLNEHRLPRKVRSSELFQIGQVRGGIKDLRKFIEESSGKQFHGPKHLHAVPLPRDWDKRLASGLRPRLVERRILPKTGFVVVDQGCPFGIGFFLMLGYVYRIQRDRCASSAFAKRRFGRWTVNPKSCKSFLTCPG